jgi:hypothetical protein
MAKSNEDRCNRQRCMDAGELAPLVTEFTRQLSELVHTDLTVRGYEAAARHLGQWLRLARVAVADIAVPTIPQWRLSALPSYIGVAASAQDRRGSASPQTADRA